MEIPHTLQTKLQRLQELLVGYGRLAVAFSGGVDSSLLLKISHDTLGDGVIALFADSLVQPHGERLGALATAKTIGAALEVIPFAPLSLAEFAANHAERCYHCKLAIFSIFLDVAKRREFPWLADGTNANDLSKHRPGMRAVAELGVKSPLADAGLTKEEIRLVSRTLGLPTWNKPSASCLATRIPTGTPITPASLSLIDKAEAFLHSLGYLGCRVRLSTTTATIELAAGDISRVTRQEDYIRVRDYLFALGANKVFLDLLERESILS